MSVIANFARLASGQVRELAKSGEDWMEQVEGGELGEDVEAMDVDKALDGLLWILERIPSGRRASEEGAGFVLQRSLGQLLRGEGGAAETNFEAGYGPAFLLSVPQVRELEGWLEGLEVPDLRARYDAAAMSKANVYPNVWAEEGISAFDGYLAPYFEELKEFFARAAALGQVVLVYFT